MPGAGLFIFQLKLMVGSVFVTVAVAGKGAEGWVFVKYSASRPVPLLTQVASGYNPYTLTAFEKVGTYTFPLAIVGVLNLANFPPYQPGSGHYSIIHLRKHYWLCMQQKYRALPGYWHCLKLGNMPIQLQKKYRPRLTIKKAWRRASHYQASCFPVYRS